MRGILTVLLLAALIIPGANGTSWYGYVETNGSDWSVTRVSVNLSFDMSSYVEGEIVPIEVTSDGRVLAPYHSRYTDIDVNDVRLKERTGALEGVYSSEDLITLCSAATNKANETVDKPAGSNIWTITYKEHWPVTLNASRTVDYQGTNINERDCVGNNFDFAGTSYLYNTDFSKKRNADLHLESMNVTVVATDETIIDVDVISSKTTDYEIESHSTGIADLKYFQTDPGLAKVNSGEGRYVGVYNIKRKLSMGSLYATDKTKADWLECCLDGCYDVEGTMGVWESGVFDCVSS